MRLAIADPPYPPYVGSGGTKPRASRWYGGRQLSREDRPADFHPEASDWDDPARHRRLLEDLHRDYDGWAIATCPDGIAAYGDLPVGCKLLAWVKPGSTPTSHRIGSSWEPVILYPPAGRRSNRGGLGTVSDVLIAPPPRSGFVGSKPEAWTRWVLDALTYDPNADQVTDLFSGSGAVAAAIAQGVLL
jgi:hypothetical protein